MSNIEFSKEEKDFLVKEIQTHFNEELEQDIGLFEAMDLFDFFEDKLGSHFYNRGLFDAQAVLSNRMDSIMEAISEIEKPTELGR